MDYSTDGVSFGSGLDWDMTSNQGLTPLVNYNFNLQVEGIYNLPCKSVRVFQRENEYEILQEGGLNDYVHMLRKPISKPMTFQVERYVGIDMLDPLALGTDLALPVILMVSRYQGEGENGVLDLSDSMQRMYTFTGCTVMAKEYGELNAERSGLLVETTTIAYREMICIDNPSTKSKRKTWSMKKDYKKMDRDAERKQAKALLGVNELTKSEMEEKAKMYVDKAVKEVPMHVLDYKGKKVTTTRNATTHQNEIGIAAKQQMAPKKEREKAATRYYMPGSVSRSSYAGSFKNSAVTNKDEVRKADMPNRKGGATIPEMKPTENQRRYDGTDATKSANTREMTPKSELETQAKSYFLPGSQSVAQYMGTVKASAALNDAEVRKADMEKAAHKGDKVVKEMKPTEKQRRYDGSDDSRSADTREMTSKTEMETQARSYYLPKSQSVAQYKGTVKASAVVNDAEVRKEKMPNRQGGAVTKEMKRPDARQGGAVTKEMKQPEARKGGAVTKEMKQPKARQGGAVTKEMKPVEPRKGGATTKQMKKPKAHKGGAITKEMKKPQARQGGATTKEMKPTEGQRRYFLPGSNSMGSYSGTVKQSATVNTDEVRKTTMQSKARQWPQTRSAADVAAFLKKN